MVMSLTAALQRELYKETPDICIVAEVWLSSTEAYRFKSSNVPIVDDAWDGILEISSITRGVDIRTGVPKVGTVSVKLAWSDAVKEMIYADPLKRSSLGIYIATRSAAISTSNRMFRGQVYDVEVAYGEYVNIVAKDASEKGWDRPATLASMNEHPLDVAESIVTQSLGADFVDAASFSPASYTDISHWVCDVGYSTAWSGDRSMRREIPAMELLKRHMTCLDGVVAMQEDGKAKFVRVDRTASVDRIWTHDDLIGPAKVLAMYGDLGNTIVTRSHQSNPDALEGFEDQVFEWKEKDTDSIADFKIFDNGVSANAEATHWYNMPHIFNWTTLLTNLTVASPGVGGTFKVWGVAANSGSRWPGYPAGSQPTDAPLSASRTAYLKIDDEIIEVDGLALSGSIHRKVFDQDKEVPFIGTYTVKSRGALGTSAAIHNALDSDTNLYRSVWDVTVPVAIARHRLELFKRGLTIVERKTTLRHMDIQVGDIVSMTDELFVKHNIDGLDSSQKWMVVSKSAPPLTQAGGAYMTWKLAMINDGTTATRPNPVSALVDRLGLRGVIRDHVRDQRSTKNYVIYGLEVTNKSGLTCDLTAGVIGNATSRFAVDTVSLTFTATKETYIFADAATGDITQEEFTIGAGTPTMPGQYIPIARIVTDASSITTDEDIRVLTSVGSRIIDTQGVTARHASLGNEVAGLVLNGEFGDTTYPRDETTRPPDAWTTDNIGIAVDPDVYWGAAQNIYFSSTSQTSGRSIMVDADSDTLSQGVRSEDFPAITGDGIFALVANVMVDDVTNELFDIRVQEYDVNKTYITVTLGTYSMPTGVSANQWHRFIMFFRTSSTARYAKISCGFRKNTAGGTDFTGYIDYIKAYRARPTFKLSGTPASMVSFAAGAATKAGFGIIDLNIKNVVTGSGTSYTAPFEGAHDFSASVYVDDVPSGVWIRLDVYVTPSGGAAAVAKKGATTVNGTGADLDMYASVDANGIYLNKGDVVDVRLTHSNGSALNQLDVVAEDNIFGGQMAQGTEGF